MRRLFPWVSMSHGYVFRIDLQYLKPPIWRRVQVPGHLTLGQFHLVLQVVMGWDNSHLHLFTIGLQSYGEPMDDLVDEHAVTLDAVLGDSVSQFHYTYDFGDDWGHLIKVEDRLDFPVKEIRVLKGKRATPPEDCGGAPGYEELLRILSDPKNEQYEEMREWLERDGDFDPEAFDLDFINKRLQGLSQSLR